MEHGDECERSGKWYVSKECRKFSTDGTSMGAIIAHMYRTDDNDEIRKIQDHEHMAEVTANLTGMDEEQLDWEEGDDDDDGDY